MTALLTVLTIAKARDGLVAGDFSAEELTTAHLDAMGSTRDLNAFVTDRKHMPAYMKARDEALADCPIKPASTLVIVSGFSRPEFVVEVEATAVY